MDHRRDEPGPAIARRTFLGAALGVHTMEGAGVRLRRAFGFQDPHAFDPFPLASGVPLREPIAWGGPIVMNTEAELQQAFREYREGTFLRHTEL
jgi:redox-sensitive bicupin YhaK (pirin superfamily)